MKKNTIKTVLLSIFTLFSLFLTAQDAPPSDEIFRLQNVETGEFLTTAGGSSQPVTMSATGEVQNTHWTFVASGAYYNIDSESDTGGTGILRAPGAGGPGGPYVVVSTLKAPPAADTDKTWTIHYDATNNTYRFGSRTTGRFLYLNEDGTITHTAAPDTDDRSNWKLIPLSQIPVGTPLRFQNVETGEFLTTAGGSSQPVTMSATGDAQNKLWTLVESGSGDYYNIDSESDTGGTGILRAPGAGGPGGPYVVVSTLKAPPAADTDKTWTIHYDATTDTYRFESRTAGRYLYQNGDGTVTHTAAPDTDDRSNWQLIPLNEPPVEVAPDEDTNPDLTCPDSGEFQNDNTRNVDIPDAVNVGTVDDRTCYSDYSEVDLYGKTWGVYNITDGSNHWDAPNTLQPRIERSLPRSQETGVGSYARFTGILRILEVGDAGSFNQDGSYLIQAKGKHTGGGGSSDPAICLYLAKPVYGTGVNADKQIAFDIYSERILERGGEGSGREVVFLKRVNKNEEVDFELEIGFRADPNDATQKIHYCDAVIGGEAFNFNIPDPERGLESGIRYGAYRVKGGRAQFRWANTTYQKAEVIDNSNIPISEGIYRLRNVETRQFLTDAGVSTTAVTMTDLGEPQNRHWTFVKSGAYFNIDSETYGILRAPGTGGPAGAYVVVSTAKASPATDTDKTWTIHYNETTNTYRFESRTAGRYLYHNEDGTVTHSKAPETDGRSVWEAIPLSEPLQLSLVSNNVSCAGADDGTASVSVTGGIAPYTYSWSSGETTESISNLAAGTYSVTVTDDINTTVTTSTEITAPSEIVLAVTDNMVLYDGYDGADQCATIGVTDVTGGEAPYQFNWSTGETTQMIDACPNSTQVYTVTVTDAIGCETIREITVEVIDVSCGTDRNPKVLICHKGRTICVAQAAVQAHLDNGDTLGECTGDPASTMDNTGTYPNSFISLIDEKVRVRAYPNPFTTLINVNIEMETRCTAKLVLLNISGNIVEEKTQQVNKGVKTIKLPMSALPIGTYYLQVFIDKQLHSTEIFIKN